MATKFFYPRTLEEASLFLLNYEDSMPLAGGTDLALQINKNSYQPRTLVDLTCLDLSYIYLNEKIIYIGSTTPICEILESVLVNEHIPILAEAARQLGSIQCRSIGTLGGNLCSAVPSADTATPLLVLNASVKLVSSNGSRIVRLDNFFTGPRQTVLEKGEILAEIQIPLPSEEERGVFIKFGRRKAVTLSTVNVAVQLLTNGQSNKIEFARLALGAVAPKPMRAANTEAYLQGKKPLDRFIIRAAELAVTEIKPISDQRASEAYRSEISFVLIQRALRTALKSSLVSE
jgi:CO/xanthine dehydrogenase FAD-binding subunit